MGFYELVSSGFIKELHFKPYRSNFCVVALSECLGSLKSNVQYTFIVLVTKHRAGSYSDCLQKE